MKKETETKSNKDREQAAILHENQNLICANILRILQRHAMISQKDNNNNII